MANEGWGARVLALQGEDGSGREARCSLREIGQERAATLDGDGVQSRFLRDFGVDPHDEKVRRAVAQVREHCRWEHAGQPFFSGEVSRVSTEWSSRWVPTSIKTSMVSSLGWSVSSSRTADGTARRRTVRFALLSIPRSESSKGCWRTNTPPAARRNRLRPAAAVKNISSNANCSGEGHRRRRRFGLAAIVVSDPLALRRAAWTRIFSRGRRSTGSAAG